MTLKKFLIMVGNDVAGEMIFDDGFAANKKLYDALVGNEYRILQLAEDVVLSRGDTFDPNTPE